MAKPVPISTIAAGVLSLLAGAARGQVTNLGVLPQQTESHAYALSASGSAAAGYGWSPKTGFRWTAAGIDDIGLPAVWATSWVLALSDDGGAAAGTGQPGAPNAQAFRWTASGGIQPLGTLPGDSTSEGWGISGDGATVVGLSTVAGGFRAFRWSAATGMVELPMLPGAVWASAIAANGDGTVIVGYCGLGPAGSRYSAPCRWTLSGGVWSVQSLGQLAGGPSTQALAVSGDGTVVTGYGGNADWPSIFRWTLAGGMQDLGSTPQGGVAAEGLSRDGRVIVGRAFGFNNSGALIWSEATGIVYLNTYLPSLGLDLSGWNLRSARGASANGLVLAGSGTYQGTLRAWRAVLPGSCYANCDGSVGTPFLNVADFTCFLQKFAAHDLYAGNCDCPVGGCNPPQWNVADFTCFLQKFAAGCSAP